jgi:hypothetical protein
MTYPQQPGGWQDPWSSQPPPAAPPTPPAPPTPSAQPMPSSPPRDRPDSGAPGSPASGPVGAPQASPAAAPTEAYQYPYQYGYGYPPGYTGYGQPVAANPPTNGMAVASMVVSIVALAGLCAYGLGGYLGIVGAILGHVARRQIRDRHEAGDGMALAGIIVGWIATGIAVLATIGIVIFVIWAANQDPSTFEGSAP